jgi:hypothetical protein
MSYFGKPANEITDGQLMFIVCMASVHNEKNAEPLETPGETNKQTKYLIKRS